MSKKYKNRKTIVSSKKSTIWEYNFDFSYKNIFDFRVTSMVTLTLNQLKHYEYKWTVANQCISFVIWPFSCFEINFDYKPKYLLHCSMRITKLKE